MAKRKKHKGKHYDDKNAILAKMHKSKRYIDSCEDTPYQGSSVISNHVLVFKFGWRETWIRRFNKLVNQVYEDNSITIEEITKTLEDKAGIQLVNTAYTPEEAARHERNPVDKIIAVQEVDATNVIKILAIEYVNIACYVLLKMGCGQLKIERYVNLWRDYLIAITKNELHTAQLQKEVFEAVGVLVELG